MHELSIAISMIDEVLEQADSKGLLDIEAVHLKLGEFSGVDRNALLFSYELACDGTLLQGSRLVIETIPLVIYCETCKTNRKPPSVYELYCPDCRGPGQIIVSGQEIELAYLEVAA